MNSAAEEEDDGEVVQLMSVLWHDVLSTLSVCLDVRWFPNHGAPSFLRDRLPALSLPLPVRTWNDVHVWARRIQSNQPVTFIKLPDREVPILPFANPFTLTITPPFDSHGNPTEAPPASSSSSPTPDKHIIQPSNVLKITPTTFKASVEQVRSGAIPLPPQSESAVISYVQTETGDIPPEVQQATDFATKLLPNLYAWIDKIPLGAEREWWAKRAPQLYASNLVILALPPIPIKESRPFPPAKFINSVPPPFRPAAGAVRKAWAHVTSCAPCKSAFITVVQRLIRFVTQPLQGEFPPNDVAESLRELRTAWISDHVEQHVYETIWTCVDPSWMYRVWPRMELAIGANSVGASGTPHNIVRLVNIAIMKWTLYFLHSRNDLEVPSKRSVLLLTLLPLYKSLHGCLSFRPGDKTVADSFRKWNQSSELSFEADFLQDVTAMREVGWERGYQLLGLPFSRGGLSNSQMFFRGQGMLGARIPRFHAAFVHSLTVLDEAVINADSMFKTSNVIDWKLNIVKVLYDRDDADTFGVSDIGRCMDIWPAAAARSSDTGIVWIPIERGPFAALGWLTGRSIGSMWSDFCKDAKINSRECAQSLNAQLLSGIKHVGMYSVATVDGNNSSSTGVINRTLCESCQPGLEFRRCGISIQLPIGLNGMEMSEGKIGLVQCERTSVWWLLEEEGDIVSGKDVTHLRWVVWVSGRDKEEALWEQQCSTKGCDSMRGFYLFRFGSSMHHFCKDARDVTTIAGTVDKERFVSRLIESFELA